MKVIPFKRPDSIDSSVDLIEDIRVDGIPFTWISNLSIEKIIEIYKILLGGHYFVRLVPNSGGMESERTVFSINSDGLFQETEFEYENGICQIIRYGEKLWAIYRTHEQYEAWIKAHERRADIESYHASQIKLLKKRERELLETTDLLVSKNRFDEAESLYLELRKLFLENKKVFRIETERSFQERLINFYRHYDSSIKGINYLESVSDDSLGRDGYYLYCLYAKYYIYRHMPDEVELIYSAALKRYPNEGRLYKKVCLYYSNEKYHPQQIYSVLLDKSISYCQQAIEKGLTDDTKNGFSGRLKRLEIQRSRLVSK